MLNQQLAKDIRSQCNRAKSKFDLGAAAKKYNCSELAIRRCIDGVSFKDPSYKPIIKRRKNDPKFDIQFALNLKKMGMGYLEIGKAEQELVGRSRAYGYSSVRAFIVAAEAARSEDC